MTLSQVHNRVCGGFPVKPLKTLNRQGGGTHLPAVKRLQRIYRASVWSTKLSKSFRNFTNPSIGIYTMCPAA